MLIENMFFGECNSYIICQLCGHTLTVPEKFMDIPLFVNGIKGVHDSLTKYFTPDLIEGFTCVSCQQECDVTKGPQIKKLPPTMTFNLTRIKYDMVTWDRIKINDRFEFPLELDMSAFMEKTPEA